MSLSDYQQKQKDWATKYYSQAIGLKITGFEFTETVDDEHDPDGPQELDWEEQFPALICEAPNGDIVRLEISRDPEGNGPGFLFGLPNVQ